MNGAINEIFAKVEHAAVMERRCPMNGEAGFDSNDLADLAHAGRIKVETYAHNFRVVTILLGPYAGKKTQACPSRCKSPWRVIDTTGTHYPRQEAKMKAAALRTRRQEPSAPRLITRAGGLA